MPHEPTPHGSLPVPASDGVRQSTVSRRGHVAAPPGFEGIGNDVKSRLLGALLDELAERVAEKLTSKIRAAPLLGNGAAPPPLMNTAAAAKWLGFSESKLRKLTRKNLIPHRKMGATVMFSAEDLEAYSAEHARSPHQARALASQARRMGGSVTRQVPSTP